ncbi:MAG: hypothetical protein JWP85_2150 [Rhodoglobus sp.]|nr:hypothetical protein [Rhodoglobus sp.]
MNAVELHAIIAPIATNGRGTKVPVLVICDGREREVTAVQVRAIQHPKRRPRDVIVILVADPQAA